MPEHRLHSKKKIKNYTILLLLVGMMLLLFVMTIVRMKGI